MDERTRLAIEGHRHANYSRTVEVAKEANRIVTGKDYGEMLMKFRSRENDEQKTQRVEITQKRTPSIEGQLSVFYRKPFREDKLLHVVEHSSKNILSQIGFYTSNFGTDGQNLMEYIEETALYYNRIDPNAFYWFQSFNDDNGSIELKPFFFSSENVYNFDIKNGAVSWAICGLSERVTFLTKKKEKKTSNIKIYYSFLEDGLYTSFLIDDNLSKNNDYYNDKKDLSTGPPTIEKVGDNKYLTIFQPYSTEDVPLSRVGYNRDLETEQNSYVTYFNNAIEEFKQLAEIGSMYDISLKLHTFLQKVQYYTRCDYVHEQMHRCKGGKLDPSGNTCPECQGTGIKVHTSGQDVILLKMPDKDETVSFSPKDLVHYVKMEMDIVKHQSEEVEKFPTKILRSVLGVDLSQEPSKAVTATQINNFTDSARDAIYEFTKAPKKMWLFTMNMIAQVLDIKVGVDGLTLRLEYPTEFNLSSEKYLIDLLDKAKKAGATPEIVTNIEDRLINKQNRTNKEFISVYNVMRTHLPFSGLEQSIREALIMELPYSSPIKALAIFFKRISHDIMVEVPTFTLMTPENQEKEINKRAEEYAKLMSDSMSMAAMKDFFLDDENMEDETDDNES